MKPLIFIIFISLILLPKVGLLDFSIIPLMIYLIFSIKKIKKFVIRREIVNALILFALLQIVALVPVIYYQKMIAEDILFKPLRQIIILLGITVIFSLNRLEEEDILNLILTAAIFNGLTILAQYVLHNTGYSINFMIVPGFDEEVNAPFRKPGVLNGYPLAGLLGVYGAIISMDRMLYTKSYFYTLSFLISSFSILLSSRMALLMLIAVIVFYGSLALLKRNKYIIISIFLILIGPVIFMYSGLVNEDTVNVMFELFINYVESGQVDTLSSNALIDSYKDWPTSWTSFFIGNGRSAQSDFLNTVDSSSQLYLFGGGIFTLILYNVALIFYSFHSYNNSYNKKIIFQLFILDFIGNFKVNYLFSRVAGDILTIIFCYSVCSISYSKSIVNKY